MTMWLLLADVTLAQPIEWGPPSALETVAPSYAIDCQPVSGLFERDSESRMVASHLGIGRRWLRAFDEPGFLDRVGMTGTERIRLTLGSRGSMVHVAFPGGVDGLRQLLGRVYQQPPPRLTLDSSGRLVRIAGTRPTEDTAVILRDGWLTIIARADEPRAGMDLTSVVRDQAPAHEACLLTLDTSVLGWDPAGTLTARLPMDPSAPITVSTEMPEGAAWPAAEEGGHQLLPVRTQARPERVQSLGRPTAEAVQAALPLDPGPLTDWLTSVTVADFPNGDRAMLVALHDSNGTPVPTKQLQRTLKQLAKEASVSLERQGTDYTLHGEPHLRIGLHEDGRLVVALSTNPARAAQLVDDVRSPYGTPWFTPEQAALADRVPLVMRTRGRFDVASPLALGARLQGGTVHADVVLFDLEPWLRRLTTLE